MWVTAVFHQVSLFSLKPADTTSTGGRSLLVPTPFSIKMALLDVALRTYGVHEGAELFPTIRDLAIAMSLPQRIIVNNCFVRILKPRREKSGSDGKKQQSDVQEVEKDEMGEADEETGGPFIRSVAFREYVQYSGPLGLAIQVDTSRDAEMITSLLMQIRYIGKRGSFFQIDGLPVIQEHLPVQQGYIRLDGMETDDANAMPGYTLQLLDDCSPRLTFTKANIYTNDAIVLGKERILRHILLPYRLARSSQSFTLYQRTQES
jgi:hypothetical protein